jgi:hypothetical protein
MDDDKEIDNIIKNISELSKEEFDNFKTEKVTYVFFNEIAKTDKYSDSLISSTRAKNYNIEEGRTVFDKKIIIQAIDNDSYIYKTKNIPTVAGFLSIVNRSKFRNNIPYIYMEYSNNIKVFADSSFESLNKIILYDCKKCLFNHTNIFCDFLLYCVPFESSLFGYTAVLCDGDPKVINTLIDILAAKSAFSHIKNLVDKCLDQAVSRNYKYKELVEYLANLTIKLGFNRPEKATQYLAHGKKFDRPVNTDALYYDLIFSHKKLTRPKYVRDMDADNISLLYSDDSDFHTADLAYENDKNVFKQLKSAEANADVYARSILSYNSFINEDKNILTKEWKLLSEYDDAAFNIKSYIKMKSPETLLALSYSIYQKGKRYAIKYKNEIGISKTLILNKFIIQSFYNCITNSSLIDKNIITNKQTQYQEYCEDICVGNITDIEIYQL